MGRWAKALGVGAAIGFATGAVVGGSLGRVFMRVLVLAEDDALGAETAMGAIVGAFTAGGTVAVYLFGGLTGLLLGAAYAVLRPLAPGGVAARTALFVTATTSVLTGFIVRSNEDDFGFLPPLLSLVLTAGAVAVTAVPLPLLVERFAPGTEPLRLPLRVRAAALGVPLAAFLAYGISGAVVALTADSPF